MRTLFAATGNDVVRISVDSSGKWSVRSVLTGAGAQCLAIDPYDGKRMYAGTFDNGLFRSDDGGRTWRPAGEGIPHQRVLSVAVSPADRTNGLAAVYAGTEPSSLYRSVDGGEKWQDLPSLREIPSAPTWSFPPRPWTSHVRWIAPHWENPGVLFAGIELGGVMRTTDGGVTWEDRKPGSYHDSHAVVTHPRAVNRVYEAAGGGVALSEDTGETWREVDQGIDRRYVWGLAVDAADPELWYVSATHSARFAHGDRESADALIYRRRGDEPWQAVDGGLAPPLLEMPYALLAPVDRPGEVFAGMRTGALWHSSDRGDTWLKVPVNLPGILALVARPS